MYKIGLCIGLNFMILQSAFCQISFAKQNKATVDTNNFTKVDRAIKAGEFGEIHSLLIVENGQLLFESYYGNWTVDSLHQLQSATKSIISTLLGCAIQNNFIKSTDEKIAQFFPKEYIQDSLKQQISIANLLTQQHGLKWKESPWEAPDNNWRALYTSSGNWYQKILETEMAELPGQTFNYSNAAPVLISGLIQQASNMDIEHFAKKYLFDPLEITQYRFWNGNGGPKNNGMALLYLSSRDMAKIGQLYLQHGKWNNKQIIPENYVQTATSSLVTGAEANGFYSSYDYGYFWWTNPKYRFSTKSAYPNVFLARGAGGQNIIVVPEKKWVVVITAWNVERPNKPQSIFDKYLLEN